jgi:hypothetical protein
MNLIFSGDEWFALRCQEEEEVLEDELSLLKKLTRKEYG